MGYLEKSLATNEVVIDRAYYHWSYRLAAILPLLLLIAAVIAGWIVYGKAISDIGLKAAEIFFLIWLLIALWIFFVKMIPVWTTEIAVTSQRFLLKRGWLRLNTQEIALPNIEGIRVSQGFWGRLLGYGHVLVEGTGVDNVNTPPIAHPVQFRRAIENAKYGGLGAQNTMPHTASA